MATAGLLVRDCWADPSSPGGLAGGGGAAGVATCGCCKVTGRDAGCVAAIGKPSNTQYQINVIREYCHNNIN